MKIAHILIGIIQLVIKYFLDKMVSSTNVKVSMNVILGLSHQFIQMGLSGFNVEQNLKDETSEETHPFSTVKLNQFLNVALCVISLFDKTLTFKYTINRLFSLLLSLHVAFFLSYKQDFSIFT